MASWIATSTSTTRPGSPVPLPNSGNRCSRMPRSDGQPLFELLILRRVRRIRQRDDVVDAVLVEHFRQQRGMDASAAIQLWCSMTTPKRFANNRGCNISFHANHAPTSTTTASNAMTPIRRISRRATGDVVGGCVAAACAIRAVSSQHLVEALRQRPHHLLDLGVADDERRPHADDVAHVAGAARVEEHAAS